MSASQNNPLDVRSGLKSRWVQLALLLSVLFCSYDFTTRLLPQTSGDKNKIDDAQLPTDTVHPAPYDSAALLANWPLNNSQSQADAAGQAADSQSAALFNSNGIKLRLMAVYAVPEKANKIHALLSYQTADSKPALLLLSPGQQVGPFTLKSVALNEATFAGADQSFTLYLFKALTREENHS